MSCSGKPGCPVADAMAKVTGGGYIAGGTNRMLVRGGVETVHNIGVAAFRATIAKLEYARDAMRGVPYEGDLRTLAGQSIEVGITWLLGDSTKIITDALADIDVANFAASGCALYPSLLHDIINEAIAANPAAGVTPLSAPPRMPIGTLPQEPDKTADALLELSVRVGEIEAYQLAAVQKAILLYEYKARVKN